MSRIQHADDPGLRIRAPWLGPANSWRWPIDATYTEWLIGSVLSIIFGFLLWLFLPAALPMTAAAWVLSRIAARAVFARHARLATASIVTLWVLVGLLAVPSWRAWLSPMPLLVAAIFAPLLAVLVTWRVGKHVTGERPLAYWLAMPGRIAAGPRPNEPTEIDPARLMLKGDR